MTSPWFQVSLRGLDSFSSSGAVKLSPLLECSKIVNEECFGKAQMNCSQSGAEEISET